MQLGEKIWTRSSKSQYKSPTILHKEFHTNSLQNYRCFENYNFQIIVMINYNWPTNKNTNHNIETMCKYVLTRTMHKRSHLVSFDYKRYFQIKAIFITMRIIYNIQKLKAMYLSVKEHQRKHEHYNKLKNLQCTCKGYK